MKINWDFVFEPVAALIKSFLGLFIGAMLGIAVLPAFVKYDFAPEVSYSIIFALLMIAGFFVLVRSVVNGLQKLHDDYHRETEITS